MSVAGVVESVAYGEIQMVLLVDMAVGIGGDKWPAADLFCQLCTSSQWKVYFSDLFKNQRCLELGSGTGLGFIIPFF
jgi:hypothetical protein